MSSATFWIGRTTLSHPRNAAKEAKRAMRKEFEAGAQAMTNPLDRAETPGGDGDAIAMVFAP